MEHIRYMYLQDIPQTVGQYNRQQTQAASDSVVINCYHRDVSRFLVILIMQMLKLK